MSKHIRTPFQIFKQLLQTPPEIRASLQLQYYQLLRVLIPSAIIISSILYLIIPAEVQSVSAIRLISLICYIISYLLIRTHRDQLSSYIFIGAIILVAYFTPLLQHRIEHINFLQLALGVGFFVLNKRSAIIVSMIVFTLIILFLKLEPSTTFDAIWPYASATAVLMLLFFIIINQRETHLKKIQEQAQIVVEHEKSKQQLLERQRQAEFHSQVLMKITHDLKTPLSVVNLYNQLLAKSDLSEKQTEFVENTRMAVDRMTGIIDDMNLLKEFAEDAPMTMNVVNVNTFIAGQSKILRDRYTQSDIRVKPFDKPILCHANQASLALLVSELVDNSVRHAGKNVVVTLQVHPDNDWVIIEVEDNGQGIPQEQVNHIFEYFFKGDQSRGSWETGSGIGLSLVRHIVNNHAGEVRVSSVVGEGSHFQIRLPRIIKTESQTPKRPLTLVSSTT